MSVYYIDPVNGCDTFDGLSPDTPKKREHDLPLVPGDTVRFRRGCVIRDVLDPVSGNEENPVTDSAYGEGPQPTFCGSVDVSDSALWEEISPHIWRCLAPIPGDVGNFVFNQDDCTATFRWSKDDLAEQGDFFDSRYSEIEQNLPHSPQEVLLYSAENPGGYYSHIECVPYHHRTLCRLRSHIVVEDLAFQNSGVHGLSGAGEDITIRHCTIRNIGGCAWNRDRRIRFGNGVELWMQGERVLVEDCTFQNIYDSCVTHQGDGQNTPPAVNFICRHNTFDTYGMAAFEYRDKLPIQSTFTDNVCRNAGCGFAMRGEELPRRSEIWPLPMGHHIFLWRIPAATPGGSLLIACNTFGAAPVGAAIYSLISPKAEAEITLQENRYTATPFLSRFGGVDYTDADVFQMATHA